MTKKKIKRYYDTGGGLAALANTQGWNQIPDMGGPQKTSLNIGGGMSGGLFGAIGSSVDATGQLLSLIDSATSKPRKNLYDTVGLHSYGGRLYDAGGAMGIASAAMELAGNAVQQAQIEDTDDLKDSITSFGNQAVSASSNDDLLSQWANRQELNHISWRDLRDKSVFGDFANSLSASGKGFAAGSAAGPIGAAVGGIVGGLSSVIGSIVGRRKAKREARKVNRIIDQANARNLASFENQADVLENQNDLDVMANFSANGGPITMRYSGVMSPFGNQFKDGGSIHIKPENRGKFTALKKRTGKSATWFKEHGTPAQKKMAVFALNAKKWKHDDGGYLNENSRSNENFSNIFFDNGSSNLYNSWNNGRYGEDKINTFEGGGQTESQANTFLGEVGEKLGISPEIGDIGASVLSFTPVGTVTGLLDLGRDIYDGVTGDRSVAPSDYLLDIVGLLPGSKVVTTSGKILKKMGATKAALSALKTGNKLKRNTVKGVRDAANRISEVTNDAYKASTEAALSRKSDIYKNAMRAREKSRAAKAVSDDIYNTMGTRAFKYNQLLTGAKAANAANDSSEALDSGINWMNDIFNAKAEGGPLFTHGGIWDNGLTYINEGGSHEENPFEGIQMGVDNQGIPNLVEEGEVVYNDYVFSNRLKVPKDVKKKLKIKGDTYADAAKYLSNESEERPNDPISKNGLDVSMNALMNSQEEMRSKRNGNQYSHGGKLGNLFDGTGKKSNRLSAGDLWYDNTPFHQNDKDEMRVFPFWVGSGLDFNVDNSDPNNITANVNWDLSYAPDSKFSKLRDFYIKNWDNPNFKPYRDRYIKRLSESNDNIDLSNFTLNDFKRITSDKMLGQGHILSGKSDRKDTDVQGLIDRLNNIDNSRTPLANLASDNWRDIPRNPIGSLKTVSSNMSEKNDNTEKGENSKKGKGNPLTWLRYAPVLGSAIGLGYGLFNKPDYSNANAILDAANDAGTYMPIQYKPIGNYLAYRPFDRDFYINKLNANAAAGRRAIQNTSGGNRAAAMAGILASDYNYGNSLGDLARQAEEYNLNQRAKVEEFNRATNMFNSQQDLRAQSANQDALMRSRAQRLSGVAQAMAMRDAIDNRRNASISANFTNLFDSLGNIGKEEVMKDWINDNPALYYTISTGGQGLGYKSKSNGGYITIKNKRRRK